MRRKFLSLFLALALCVGVMPATALADTDHVHCVCGGDTAIGDHISHENITFTEWTYTDSMPTTAGNYVLMNDVTISATWEPANGTILCLNGHTLECSANISAITLNESTTFTLCDCKGTGVITHSSGVNGRGVNANCSTAVFYMYGGNISGNSSIYDAGGGISLDGTFIMYGGTIKNNNVEYGGGIYLSSNYTSATMYGGSIESNSSSFSGGGVKIYQGTFTMDGGIISGNASEEGGGVQNNGTFIMNGGTISSNTSTKAGGGVQNTGTFTMNGGTIIENTSTNSSGGGVYSSNSITISGDVTITKNIAQSKTNNLHLAGNGTDDAKIVIGTSGMDSTASVGVSVDSGHSKVICNNGAFYVNNFTSDDTDYEVTVDSDTLKLTSHTHSLTYSASENIITESCTNGCSHSATATISASTDLAYDGSAKMATVTYGTDWKGNKPTITYYNSAGTQINASEVVNVGTYTAKITIGGATASVEFKITIQLDTPTGLAWNGSTATWTAVSNASSYSVQLYKDGTAEGSAVTTTDTSYAFTITEAGSYTFKVTAIGEGNYSDSETAESEAIVYYTVTWSDGSEVIETQIVQSGDTPTAPANPTKEADSQYTYTFAG